MGELRGKNISLHFSPKKFQRENEGGGGRGGGRERTVAERQRWNRLKLLAWHQEWGRWKKLFLFFFLLVLPALSFVFVLPPLVAHQKITGVLAFQWISISKLVSTYDWQFWPRQLGHTQGGEVARLGSSHTHHLLLIRGSYERRKLLLSCIIKGEKVAPRKSTSFSQNTPKRLFWGREEGTLIWGQISILHCSKLSPCLCWL